eukprot:12417312-Ditylum_brightwellii.AAC.1
MQYLWNKHRDDDDSKMNKFEAKRRRYKSSWRSIGVMSPYVLNKYVKICGTVLAIPLVMELCKAFKYL